MASKAASGNALRARMDMASPKVEQLRAFTAKPYRKLQVRLRETDAKRFVRLAEDNGYESIQDALVAAMDRLMADLGDRVPLHNPGANKADE